jgi:hypothetical protein
VQHEDDEAHRLRGGQFSIIVLAREPDAIHFVGTGPGGRIEVIAGIRVEDDLLVLEHVHVDGPGIGSFGPRRLRQLARELGASEGVKRVRIIGARRTTGANPGHAPRPIEIEID